jgi:homoserine O-succinyltransferase
LYHHYGVPKQVLPQKLFGVYPHVLERKRSMLFRGLDDVFYIPHSRHTSILREDVLRVPELRILASSAAAGVCALCTDRGRQVFVLGHLEYDAHTLHNEYMRDVQLGLPIAPPVHYYPQDDPALPPQVTWRGSAHLFFANWLNYYVYQSTPYVLTEIRGD